MDINSIRKPIRDKLISLGYDLYDLKLVRDKGDIYLSIIVDKDGDMDLDEITNLSNILSSYLDEIDDSSTPYILDVSSAGAEKIISIDKLDKYINRYIHIHLTNPIEGENIYEGTLKSVTDSEITFEITKKTRTKSVTTHIDNIRQIRLAIKF